jgi:hypothetical protein
LGIGKVVIKPDFTFSYASIFHEGLSVAQPKNGTKTGYIDRSGKFVIEPKFDFASEFKNGLAKVRQGKIWGYIDRTGKYVWSTDESEQQLPRW